mmetsp:Transcript_34468/g.80055  ORF Transcript_34468/g.80055 Transcript_34468/m.80055 type:complete len:163 (-) Transcript_34468:209-697(-)
MRPRWLRSLSICSSRGGRHQGTGLLYGAELECGGEAGVGIKSTETPPSSASAALACKLRGCSTLVWETGSSPLRRRSSRCARVSRTPIRIKKVSNSTGELARMFTRRLLITRRPHYVKVLHEDQYILTDPAILCGDVDRFGDNNLSHKGMERSLQALGNVLR